MIVIYFSHVLLTFNIIFIIWLVLGWSLLDILV